MNMKTAQFPVFRIDKVKTNSLPSYVSMDNSYFLSLTPPLKITVLDLVNDLQYMNNNYSITIELQQLCFGGFWSYEM